MRRRRKKIREHSESSQKAGLKRLKLRETANSSGTVGAGKMAACRDDRQWARSQKEGTKQSKSSGMSCEDRQKAVSKLVDWWRR